MKRTEAIKQLARYDQKGKYVFTHSDFAKIFHQDSQRALRAGIQRLIKDGVLIRACNEVYVNALAQSKDSNILEQIAKTIRRGEYNYISLESALSDYGVISQIPIDRLTVMTTGRSAEFKTPFGTIEYTHTKRNLTNILEHTVTTNRPLRLAKKATAWRDLKRVGRNTHLVDKGELNEQ